MLSYTYMCYCLHMKKSTAQVYILVAGWLSFPGLLLDSGFKEFLEDLR